MAVVNRALDTTQQKEMISANFSAAQLVNGSSAPLGIVHTPSVVTGGQMALGGVSGAPAYSIVVHRFIAGSGVTAIVLCSSQVIIGYGTSGALPSGLSLPASGSTLLNLQANDYLYLLAHGGTGAAANFLSVSVVLRPLQDIKKHFGGVA